jgi:hypothetical protein
MGIGGHNVRVVVTHSTDGIHVGPGKVFLELLLGEPIPGLTRMESVSLIYVEHGRDKWGGIAGHSQRLEGSPLVDVGSNPLGGHGHVDRHEQWRDAPSFP